MGRPLLCCLSSRVRAGQPQGRGRDPAAGGSRETTRSQLREGGIFAGQDYEHPQFPGVQKAVDEFFGRLGWQVTHAGDHVWWVVKGGTGISFVMPVFNAEQTLRASLLSIAEGNLAPGDEIVVCDDGSTDGSAALLESLQAELPALKVVRHERNRGGGAARNTAVKTGTHPLLFCLDSDNLLEPGTVAPLKAFLLGGGWDVAAFQELRYFRESPAEVTHRWVYEDRAYGFSDYLDRHEVPGASGNYLFTRWSWEKAGGYPENAGALDAWGFGLGQAATGARLGILPGLGHRHRWGHESYWVRQSKETGFSAQAARLVEPWADRWLFKRRFSGQRAHGADRARGRSLRRHHGFALSACLG